MIHSSVYKCSSKQVIRNQHTEHNLNEDLLNNLNGNRYIFKGHKEDPMFEMEANIDLPKLEEGEILVKVRAATICLSDIHTVCGHRMEPTPRCLNIFKT